MFNAAEALFARTERMPPRRQPTNGNRCVRSLCPIRQALAESRLVALKSEQGALTNWMSQMAQGMLHWYNFVGTC